MTSSSKARRMLKGCTAAATVAVLALAPVAAGADAYTGNPPPKVLGNDTGADVRGASLERGGTVAIQSTDRGGALAVTGSDVLPLTVVGFGALGAGTALVLKSRRRRAI